MRAQRKPRIQTGDVRQPRRGKKVKDESENLDEHNEKNVDINTIHLFPYLLRRPVGRYLL